MDFFKYNDNPEVWDSTGHHYSSYGELVKAGGAGKVQTITRSNQVVVGPPAPKAQLPNLTVVKANPQQNIIPPPKPTPVLGPAAPHALWQLSDGNIVNTMQLNTMQNPPAAKPVKESLPTIIKSQFDVTDPRGFAGGVAGGVKAITNEVQRAGVEGYNVATGTKKFLQGDMAGANAELNKPRTIFGSQVSPTLTNAQRPGPKELLDVAGQGVSLASNFLIPSGAYNIATQAGKTTLRAAVVDLLKTQTLPGALYGAGQSLEQGQGVKDTLKNIAVNALATTVLGTVLEGKQLAQLTAQELRTIQTKFADELVTKGYTREAAAQMAKEGGFLGFFDSPKVQNMNREWDRIQAAKENATSKTAIKNYENAQKKIEDQIWKERQAGFIKNPFAKEEKPLPEINTIAQKAAALTEKNGGVTINLKGDTPTTGYAVAPNKATETVVPSTQFHQDPVGQIEAYISAHLEELQAGNAHLGTWIDPNGNFVADVSHVVQTPAEAARIAEAGNQDAFFNLSNYETTNRSEYQKIISASENATRGNPAALRRTNPSLDQGQVGRSSGQTSEPKLELPVPAKKDSLLTKLRNQLKPILGTDAESQAIYKDYVAAKLSSKESANVEAKTLTEVPKKEGWSTILNYEKGKATPFTGKIKTTFDNLHAEAVAKGLDVPYRENYVPQMYKNSPEEVALAVAQYMKDKGVAPQVIADYIAGKEIPAEIAGPLKLNPSFTKQRVLPDYATAIQYGLAPKYTHPAQLAAAYRQSMQDALDNRNLIGQLVDSGKLVESKGAPIHFKPVDLSFSPKGYYAEPKLANALNGLARDEANLTFGQSVLSKGAKTSKFMQELALSAGFPGTDVNFFAMGIGLVKQLTGRVGEAVTHPILATVGAGKDIAAFIRANVDSASIKFFERKAETLQRMADNGIDLSQRIGTYRDMYKNVVAKKSWGEVLGKGWDTAFQKKTFASLMPQHFVNTFEEAYTAAIKKGMNEAQAGAFAADVTRNLHGIVEDVARSKGTEDGLSAAFFAPKFREGVIGTLWNTGKSLSTELRNPAFAKNRQLATGIVLTYGMYQALNQKYNGNYTWDNEPGHENDIKIPLPGGKNVLYVPFMPSFASMPRNLFSAGKAIATGDFKTATQKISSFASMPLQITTQLWSNRDYFDNPIYKDTDTREIKIQKMAQYLGLQANHPYLKLLGNYISNKQEPDKQFRKPLIQSLLEASEFPVKFETLDRLSRSQFYDAITKKTQENADTKRRIQPIYDQVQKLRDEGKISEADAITRAMSKEDYAVYKSIKASGTRSDTIGNESRLYKTYQQVQDLVKQGRKSEADAITRAMSKDDYHAYTLLKQRFNP